MPSNPIEAAAFLRLSPRIEKSVAGDRARLKQLFSDEMRHLVVATGSRAKAAMIYSLLGSIVDMGEFDSMAWETEPCHSEPVWSDAQLVAKWKVEQAKEKRTEKGSHQHGEWTVGADATVFLDSGEEGLQRMHSLKRGKDSLSEEELLKLFHELKKQYCTASSGPNGQIRVVWNVALAALNGRRSFSEGYVLEMVAKPVDPQLLEMFFIASIKNSALTRSALHFMAIECLVAASEVESIALVPTSVLKEGFSIAQFRQDVRSARVPLPIEELLTLDPPELVKRLLGSKDKDGLLSAAILSAITTVPVIAAA